MKNHTEVNVFKQNKNVSYSASINLDKDLRILSISESWWDLYGIKQLFPYTSIIDISRQMVDAGWFCLSNAFSERNAYDDVKHKILNNRYFHDFHISPLGKVIEVTYFKEFEGGNKLFTYTSTGITLDATAEIPTENRGLLALRDLAELGMFGISPMNFKKIQTDIPTYVPVICAPQFGQLIILDKLKIFPELDNITCVQDLSIKINDINFYLDKDGQYSSIIEQKGCKSLRFFLERQFFYLGGPCFLAGRFMRIDISIFEADILKKYPQFSAKEVEVVYLLTRGNTIKEIAAKIGKAKVTVSLQARSALLKSRERSINALIATISNSWGT